MEVVLHNSSRFVYMFFESFLVYQTVPCLVGRFSGPSLFPEISLKYSLLSISGTSTGPKKMAPLIECSTYPNCSIIGTFMKPKKGFTYRTSPLSDFSGERGIYEY